MRYWQLPKSQSRPRLLSYRLVESPLEKYRDSSLLLLTPTPLSGCVCIALVCGLWRGAGCRPEVPLQIPISTAHVSPRGLGGSCRSIWQEQGKFLCLFFMLLSHPYPLCVVPCFPLRTGGYCSWPSLAAISTLPSSHVPGTPENSL